MEHSGAANYEFQRCRGGIVGIAIDVIGGACNKHVRCKVANI